jgi:hypothetical protein
MDVDMIATPISNFGSLVSLCVMADSLLALDKFVMTPVPAAQWQTLHAHVLWKK